MNTYHDGSGTLPGANAPYEAFGVHAPRRGTRHCWWAAIGLLGALQLLTLWQVLALTTNFHADVIALASTKRSEMTTSLSQDIRGTTLERPKKLLLGGLTPTADQMMRGDCWLFSVMGVLEDSYRRFGVEHGWLDPNVYLRLSRQAFGIMVMKTCQRHPSALCPAKANKDGPVLWGNTTEGADERMLYFLKDLSTDALPDAVCPYSPTAAGEADCDGLDAALATNPLRFNVTAADMLYEYVDMQRALIQKQHVLTLGIPMVVNEYYLPCTDATAPYYRCNPHDRATCVPCPLDRAFGGVDCCVAARRPMVTMRGEWHHRSKMILLGGHAINVVGYTDSYTDEWGNRGGFIIRNSWNDGLGTAHGSTGRGSHSAAYYMRDVYDYDEALTCPNPHSPRSWSTCKTLAECTNPVTAVFARVARKPLELVCTDSSNYVSGVCEQNASYFLTNLTEFDADGLFVGCFLRARDGESVCVPPLLIDDLASVFTPRLIEHVNDPTVCGFNFLPYKTLEAMRSRFGSVVAGDFDIKWERSSYASQLDPALAAASDAEDEKQKAQRRRGGDERLNYTLVLRSTKPMPKTAVQAGALWV